MKARTLIVSIFFGFCGCASTLQGGAEVAGESKLTGVAIVKALSERQGKDLLTFLSFLGREFDPSNLKDQEIDQALARLRTIQKSDPYQVTRKRYKSEAMVDEFSNREATSQCVFHLEFQKVANSFRGLPLEQRVSKIIGGMENWPALAGYATHSSFREELIRAGKEAVSFIIQHEPKAVTVQDFIFALIELREPKCIDYISDVLKTKGDSFNLARPCAARALAKFDDKRAIAPLVAALQDETFKPIDRHQPQLVADMDGHNAYIGRYYTVQHAAAESLTELTGKDWGIFYNEDYKTWASWLHSEHPDKFTPITVLRSDKEVAQLIELLFHRYMSARPNVWQPQNILASPDTILIISKDLKQLGARVVPAISQAYQTRIKETPLWKAELRKWTQEILMALAWDEAVKAATGIE